MCLASLQQDTIPPEEEKTTAKTLKFTHEDNNVILNQRVALKEMILGYFLHS